MATSTSRAVFGAVLATGSFKATMDGCVLNIYSGTVPVNTNTAMPDAEAAIGSAVLLMAVTGPAAAGLVWASAAVGSTINKDSTQVWSGTGTAAAGAGGTAATFFRYMFTSGDDGSADTTGVKKRIQGTVGGTMSNTDLILANPVIATDAERIIGSASYSLVSPT